MEHLFRSLTIFDFQKRFTNDSDGLSYLSALKWAKGYRCPKCGNTKYCDGDREFSRRGTHHRVDNLQAYMDEYCYRFNRNKMKEGIFYTLLMRMVKAAPMSYKIYGLNA